MEKSRTDPGMDRWFIPAIRSIVALDLKTITFGEVFSIFFMQRWGGFLCVTSPQQAKQILHNAASFSEPLGCRTHLSGLGMEAGKWFCGRIYDAEDRLGARAYHSMDELVRVNIVDTPPKRKWRLPF